jgi:hypothetical protein
MGALQNKDLRLVRESQDSLHLDVEGLAWPVKAKYQLASVLKKYAFKHDVYTPAQVDAMSKKKYIDNQLRLEAISHRCPRPLTAAVKGWARGYLQRVMGDYDAMEHLSMCKFGRRASVGVPFKFACEGERIELPISGSRDQITWFDKVYLTYHQPLRAYLDALAETLGLQRAGIYHVVDHLSAVLVPKTYKSRRMIVPNTTIGGLYSSGLGDVSESRLRGAGYDIKVLQMEHRELARVASNTGVYVTADQSLASDNITELLVRDLFTQRWADAFAFGRVHKLYFGKEEVPNHCFAGMGVGFTFPLQTLVFLSLLKGIAANAGKHDAVVSVYGDDLIYESWMHADVVEVFTDLGLAINEDKTFSKGFFRESCGGDYHRGMDVRPWIIPEAKVPFLSRRKYEAFLYKLINGLLRRWDQEDVPRTCQTIMRLIRDAKGSESPFMVPVDYPDTSGVHVRSRFHLPAWLGEMRVPSIDPGTGWLTFEYLGFVPDTREETRHAPYLWRRLQDAGESDLRLADARERRVRLDWPRHYSLPLDTSPDWKTYLYPREREELFTEEKVSERFDNELPSARHRDDVVSSRQTVTTISSPDMGRYLVQTGSTFTWT